MIYHDEFEDEEDVYGSETGQEDCCDVQSPFIEYLRQRVKANLLNYMKRDYPDVIQRFEAQDKFDIYADDLVYDVLPSAQGLADQNRHMAFSAYQTCMRKLTDQLGYSYFHYVLSVLSQEYRKEYMILKASKKLRDVAIRLAIQCHSELSTSTREDFETKKMYYKTCLIIERHLEFFEL